MLSTDQDKAVQFTFDSIKQMITLQTAIIAAQLAAVWAKSPYPSAKTALYISVSVGAASIVAGLLCFLTVASDLLESKTPKTWLLLTFFSISWLCFLSSGLFGAIFAFK